MDLAGRFADNLLHRRREADLSQEELATRASLHRTAISEMEKGERLPRLDTLVKLAGALATKPETLLEGIGWEPTQARTGGFKVAKPKR